MPGFSDRDRGRDRGYVSVCLQLLFSVFRSLVFRHWWRRFHGRVFYAQKKKSRTVRVVINTGWLSEIHVLNCAFWLTVGSRSLENIHRLVIGAKMAANGGLVSAADRQPPLFPPRPCDAVCPYLAVVFAGQKRLANRLISYAIFSIWMYFTGGKATLP